MDNPFDVIRRPLVTEKGVHLAETRNCYPFMVNPGANKIQIKEAVEKIFKVKVKKVHVMNRRGKKKRIRFRKGKSSDWKRALVTLAEGNTIEFI